MTKYNAQLVSGLALIISAIPPFSANRCWGEVQECGCRRVRSSHHSYRWRVRIITGCKRARTAALDW
jgi:hypothetical protein